MPHTEDKSASRNQKAITIIKKNTFLICFSYLPIIWWCLLIHLVWCIHCKSRSASEIMKITPPNQTSIFHRLELSDKQEAKFTGSLPFCLLTVCIPWVWLSNTVLGSHAHITVMYRCYYYLYTFQESVIWGTTAWRGQERERVPHWQPRCSACKCTTSAHHCYRSSGVCCVSCGEKITQQPAELPLAYREDESERQTTKH